MATIKAGTYRFHDVLRAHTQSTNSENINYTVRAYFFTYGVELFAECTKFAFFNIDGGFQLNFICKTSEPDMTAVGVEYPFGICVYDTENLYGFTGWNNAFDDAIKTITIPSDTEVSAEFYEWFTANATQPTASIRYNGSAIASLFGGERAILKCAGMKMEEDVVVEAGEQIGGNCDHEVYDLSMKFEHVVRLKHRIERPTEAQIAGFVGGSIAFIPADVERLYGATTIDYQTAQVAEGVTISALYFKAKISDIIDRGSLYAYYLWEEDVETAKVAFAYMGMDTSGVTGEGWQLLSGSTLTTMTKDELAGYDFNIAYSLVIPNSYFESLFEHYVYEHGTPADIVTMHYGSQGYVFSTQDKLCQKDIFVKNNVFRSVSVFDASGTFAQGESEYDDICYISADFIGDNASNFYLNVTSNWEGDDVHGDDAYLSAERVMLTMSRSYVKYLTITAQGGKKIGAVYTNATVVSQSDTEVYISGLRHDTHIVVVEAEE